MKIKRILAFVLCILLVVPTAAISAAEQSETLFEFKASDSVILEVTSDLTAAHFDGPADDNTTELLPDGTAAPQYVIFENFKANTENYITMRYFGSGADSPKDFSDYDKENTKLEVYLKAKPLLENNKYKNIYLGLGTANREDHGWGDQVLAVDLAKYIQDANISPEGDWYKIQMPLSYMVANGKTVNASALGDSDYIEAGGYDVSKSWRYRQINSNQEEFCWKHVWGMSIGVVTNEEVTSEWSDELYMSNPKIVKYTQQTTTPDASDGETLFELKADTSVIMELSQDFSASHFNGPNGDNTTVLLPDETAAPQYLLVGKAKAQKPNFITMRYWGNDRNSSPKDFSEYDKKNTKLELWLRAKPLLDSGNYKKLYIGFGSANFDDHGWYDQAIAVDVAEFITSQSLVADGEWYKLQIPLDYIEQNGLKVNASAVEQAEFEAAGGDYSQNWKYRYITDDTETAFCWKHVWGITVGAVTNTDFTEEWNDTIYFSNPKIVKYTAQTVDPEPDTDPEPTPDPTPDTETNELANITFEEDVYAVGEDINGKEKWTVEQRESDSAKVVFDPDNSSNKVLAVTIDNTNAENFTTDYFGAKLNFADNSANGTISISYKMKTKNSDGVTVSRPWRDRVGFVNFGLESGGEYTGMHLMGGDSSNYMYSSLIEKSGDAYSDKTWLAGESLDKWLKITYLLNPKDYSVKVTAEQLGKTGNEEPTANSFGTDGSSVYINALTNDASKNTTIKKVNNILFSIGASGSSGKSTLYIDDISIKILPFLTAEAKFDTLAANAEAPLEIAFNNKITSNLEDAVSICEKSGAAFPGKISAELSQDGKTAKFTAEGDLKFDTEYVLKLDSAKIKDEYDGTLQNDFEVSFKTAYSNYAYISGFKSAPLYSNGTLEAKFELKNASGSAVSPLVAIASYNEKGVMTGIVFKEYKNVDSNGVSDSLKIENLKEAPKSVTAFVWEGKDNLLLRQKPFTYSY